MGSDESHFNVSLIVRNKVTRQCSQTTILEEKREPKQIRTEVPLLTSLTARPKRLTGQGFTYMQIYIRRVRVQDIPPVLKAGAHWSEVHKDGPNWSGPGAHLHKDIRRGHPVLKAWAAPIGQRFKGVVLIGQEFIYMQIHMKR